LPCLPTGAPNGRRDVAAAVLAGFFGGGLAGLPAVVVGRLVDSALPVVEVAPEALAPPRLDDSPPLAAAAANALANPSFVAVAVRGDAPGERGGLPDAVAVPRVVGVIGAGVCNRAAAAAPAAEEDSFTVPVVVVVGRPVCNGDDGG
jgi:hypothetical protein